MTRSIINVTDNSAASAQTHETNKAPMSSYNTETTVEHQVLRIKSKSGLDHTVLITTSQRMSKFHALGEDQQHVVLDVLASYISGPIPLGHFTHGHVSRMGGTVDTLSKYCRVTNKSVMVAPSMQGTGIGTYMQDVIVRWAKTFDPQLPIETIKVAVTDATPTNQLRRNLYYSHFGILFSESPDNEGVVAALSLPMCISDLKSHDGWKSKIKVLELDNVLRQQETTCIDLEKKIVDFERADNAKGLALQDRKARNIRTLRISAGIILALLLALWWRW